MPAVAQAYDVVAGGMDLTSDQRRRGLSWSDGRPTAAAWIDATVAEGITLGATATALRGSVRHGGADAAIDLQVRVARDLGAMTLSGGGTGHLFAGGAGRLDYVEFDAALGYLIGPAQLALTAAYAPRQAAIGGDNLHLGASATVAVIGTPLTAVVAGGRTWGRATDPVRAARLRPGGGYWDGRIALEAAFARHAAGVRLTTTSIGGDRRATRFTDRHTGTRLAAYLRLGL